jgi:hypothetical protein
MTSEPLTGMALELRRVAARVKVKDVARAMGITPSRVSRIEDQPTVTDRLARRYLEALAECGTSGTSGKAA